jgi:hypothetical protein
LSVTVDGFPLPYKLEGSTAISFTTWPHNPGKVNVVVHQSERRLEQRAHVHVRAAGASA